MRESILSTKKFCKTFSTGGLQQHVLKNMDLEIYEGDFTVIMGPSGAGKSTLLYALSGMDKPTLGEINFSGQEISKLSNDKLAVFRRDNCGFVFQQMYLLDNMSVLDNVLACGYLALNSGRSRATCAGQENPASLPQNRKAVISRAKSLLQRLNIDETIWRKFPKQISGGEAQRAGSARALINNPKIVFADEPTGALNSANGKAVLDALTEVNDSGQSVVMVSQAVVPMMTGILEPITALVWTPQFNPAIALIAVIAIVLAISVISAVTVRRISKLHLLRKCG
jgi:putative ABC transport system ATP-binding protein